MLKSLQCMQYLVIIMHVSCNTLLVTSLFKCCNCNCCIPCRIFFFCQTNLIHLNFVRIKNNHRRTAHTATAQCQLFYTWADTCSSINFNLLYEDHVKKNQLDAKLFLSIFCQPLHVSDISRPIIRRYNHMYTTVGTYYPTRTTDSHLKRIISNKCWIHTVVPPDDGPRYARNM
jgi:hypothetical protein